MISSRKLNAKSRKRQSEVVLMTGQRGRPRILRTSNAPNALESTTSIATASSCSTVTGGSLSQDLGAGNHDSMPEQISNKFEQPPKFTEWEDYTAIVESYTAGYKQSFELKCCVRCDMQPGVFRCVHCQYDVCSDCKKITHGNFAAHKFLQWNAQSLMFEDIQEEEPVSLFCCSESSLSSEYTTSSEIQIIDINGIVCARIYTCQSCDKVDAMLAKGYFPGSESRVGELLTFFSISFLSTLDSLCFDGQLPLSRAITCLFKGSVVGQGRWNPGLADRVYQRLQQGCTNWKAGTEKPVIRASKHDVNGFFGLFCRHNRLLTGCNIITAGCRISNRVKSMVSASGVQLNSVTCAVNAFHVLGHERQCQLKYSVRVTPGAGLCDGENTERAWSALRPFGKSLKYMRSDRRNIRMAARSLPPGLRVPTMIQLRDFQSDFYFGLSIDVSERFKRRVVDLYHKLNRLAEEKIIIVQEWRDVQIKLEQHCETLHHQPGLPAQFRCLFQTILKQLQALRFDHIDASIEAAAADAQHPNDAGTNVNQPDDVEAPSHSDVESSQSLRDTFYRELNFTLNVYVENLNQFNMDPDQFICPMCDYSTNRSATLLRHARSKHTANYDRVEAYILYKRWHGKRDLKLCQLCSSFAASNMRQHMRLCHFGEAFVVGRAAVADARARAYDRIEGLRLLAFYGIRPQLNLNPALPLESLPESAAAITMDADLATDAEMATSNEVPLSVRLQRGEANKDGLSNDPPFEPTVTSPEDSNSHAAAVAPPAMAANRELLVPESAAAATIDVALSTDAVPATSNEVPLSVRLQRGEANKDGLSNDPPFEPTVTSPEDSNSHAAAVAPPAMAANRERLVPDTITTPDGACTPLLHVTPHGRASRGSPERSLPTEMASMRQLTMADVVRQTMISTGNVVVQAGSVDAEGLGAFARTDLPKGTVVCTYGGELIQGQKARLAREEDIVKQGKPCCFLFFFSWRDQAYCIDATNTFQYVGRYINHSRRRNNLKPIVADVNNKPHLVFQAIRDIARGEELLYDYGERRSDIRQHYEKRLHRVDDLQMDLTNLRMQLQLQVLAERDRSAKLRFIIRRRCCRACQQSLRVEPSALASSSVVLDQPLLDATAAAAVAAAASMATDSLTTTLPQQSSTEQASSMSPSLGDLGGRPRRANRRLSKALTLPPCSDGVVRRLRRRRHNCWPGEPQLRARSGRRRYPASGATGSDSQQQQQKQTVVARKIYLPLANTTGAAVLGSNTMGSRTAANAAAATTAFDVAACLAASLAGGNDDSRDGETDSRLGYNRSASADPKSEDDLDLDVKVDNDDEDYEGEFDATLSGHQQLNSEPNFRLNSSII
uniref:B box-type domain-containing protein n=1 Tax=Macrostomum lignano TaxID=282301 RepID=A0A1I8J3S7_9PLAT